MKTNIYDIDKNESRMDRNNYHVYYIATHSKLTIDQIANYLGRSNASIVLDLLPYICNGYFESVEHLAPNFNIITKYCSDFEIVAGLIGVIPVFQTSQQYYESKRKEIIKDIGFHNGIRVSIAEMTVCCYFSVSRKQDRETIFKIY